MLQILGRGAQVETAGLIWNWIGQTAETLRKPDPGQAKQLAEIVEEGSKKNANSLQVKIEQYRRNEPDSYYADLASGAASLSEGRLKDAFEMLNRVYAKCPRNVTALYALGHCCERLGMEAEAIAFYQDCLKFKNFLQLPRQRLAAIHFKNGQIEKTTREYEKLRDEYPDDLQTSLTLGYLYIASKKLKRAIDTFSTAVLIQPDNFNPDDDAIDTLIETGDYEAALRKIDKVLENFPGRPELLLRRGFVLSRSMQHEEALDCYRQAVTISPDFLEANIRLGSHYTKLNRPDLAAYQLTRAILVNDRLVDAYIGMATAHNLAGKTNEAVRMLSFASSIETNTPILLAETAWLRSAFPGQVRQHQNNQPITDTLNEHSRLIASHPHNSQLYCRFGCFLMSAGRISQAIESFKKAIELNPTIWHARNKLAVCLYEADEKAFAVECLLPPACIQDETLRLHYQLALLHCDKNRFSSSLSNLAFLLRDNFTSEDAAGNIEVVLQNLGLIDPTSAYWDNQNLANNLAQANN